MAVPLSREEVDAQLDDLSLRLLELCEDLMKAKVRMEQAMREGFVLMAKARYSGGFNSVSALQLPSPNEEETSSDEEKRLQAIIKVRGEECLREENCVRFNYLSIVEEVCEEASPTSLIHRKGQVESASGPKKGPRDPINLFGVLVPQSLRQSQQFFKRSVELSVETTNIQNEIQGMQARKKFLLRIKDKLEKGNTPA